eukprot:3217818-Rhodomonas_salina.2
MRLYFLRDMVCDCVVKLIKVQGMENVADTLTKSLQAPAFEKHRQYLWGSGVPFSSYWVTLPGPAWESLASFKVTIHAWEMLCLAAEREFSPHPGRHLGEPHASPPRGRRPEYDSPLHLRRPIVTPRDFQGESEKPLAKARA